MGDICRMNSYERMAKKCSKQMDEWAKDYFLISISGGIPEMVDGPTKRDGCGVKIIDVDNLLDVEYGYLSDTNCDGRDIPKHIYLEQWYDL